MKKLEGVDKLVALGYFNAEIEDGALILKKGPLHDYYKEHPPEPTQEFKLARKIK